MEVRPQACCPKEKKPGSKVGKKVKNIVNWSPVSFQHQSKRRCGDEVRKAGRGQGDLTMNEGLLEGGDIRPFIAQPFEGVR